ncbi:MAG: adenylyl-sulfate kinase [Bacteroidetes bacterium]|nr:MAG: adenylyl-sulfate kinase [Bacteroidota bacterium]
MKQFSRKRHIAKTLTWRLVGTLDTMFISWLISGDFKIGIAIGGAEVLTKLVLYYLHERIWYNTRIFTTRSSRTRHILKTFTWRLVGTADTMFMGWLISGDPTVGLKIGALELITKMILYYLHERMWYRTDFGLIEIIEEHDQEEVAKSQYIYKQDYEVSRRSRSEQNGHASFMVLFTGLSGSGKSTIANELEKILNQRKIKTYLLDGDNVRFGMNKDLGFSEEDRTENLRRIAEMSKLFVDSGTVVLAAFVSPLIKDRQMIKSILGTDDFVEVYVNTPLEECEKRDIKGLYEKARNGEIENFTGISAPYEPPVEPDIEISTIGMNAEECAAYILNKLEDRLTLPHE